MSITVALLQLSFIFMPQLALCIFFRDLTQNHRCFPLRSRAPNHAHRYFAYGREVSAPVIGALWLHPKPAGVPANTTIREWNSPSDSARKLRRLDRFAKYYYLPKVFSPRTCYFSLVFDPCDNSPGRHLLSFWHVCQVLSLDNLNPNLFHKMNCWCWFEAIKKNICLPLG